MTEKTLEFNGLPLYPFTSEFNLSTYQEIIDHALDNQISALLFVPGKPIEAVFHGQTFNLHERSLFAFETAGVVSKLVDADDDELVRSTGRLSDTQFTEKKDGRKVGYNRTIEYDSNFEFSISLDFTVEFVMPAEQVEIAFTSLFAGAHDGAVYPLSGYLNKDSLDDMLRWAGDRKASDITITPDQYVMAEIGGKLVPITDRIVSSDEIESCVRYVYGENGPAEILGGSDLDPSHEVRMKGQRIRRYRINITGGRIKGGTGMQMTIRTLPSSPIPIEQLGIEAELLAATRPSNGIVFICGPTGSGKSTLMSSIIRMIVERPDANEKVLEYSQPIEYVFDDVVMPSSTIFQTHVGKHLRPKEKGVSQWAYAARNSLRRKPKIIMLGEARDAETIEEAVNISQEGHLTYTTMHTNSVAETINRAINVFPFEVRDRMCIDLMGALRMIVVQTLVPRIGGGMVGCREFMVFDPKTRERFMRTPQKTWPVLIQRMLNEELCIGRTMRKSALILLRDGVISMETFELIAEAGGTV